MSSNQIVDKIIQKPPKYIQIQLVNSTKVCGFEFQSPKFEVYRRFRFQQIDLHSTKYNAPTGSDNKF